MRQLALAIVAFALAALAACSSGATDPVGHAEPSTVVAAPPSRSPTTSATPTPAPTPAPLPAAADGSNLEACADGTCEVRVEAGAVVPLRARSTRTATVTSVDAASIVLTGPFHGGSISGSGSASLVGSSASGPGSFTVTLEAGGHMTFNDELILDVVAIGRSAAVLRIRRA